MRSVPALQHLDNSAAAWAYAHRTAFATSGLRVITQLGNIQLVAGLAIVLAAVDLYRTRNHWSLSFLITVMVGMELNTDAVKGPSRTRATSARPRRREPRAFLPEGPFSDGSQHLLRGSSAHPRQDAPTPPRHALIGIAVAITVAVAASRVLLDLHWLSDVIGGLALGWGWFALSTAPVRRQAPQANSGDRHRRRPGRRTGKKRPSNRPPRPEVDAKTR